MKLVYIANPYTHPDIGIMYARAGRITQITAELQYTYKATHTFISPIVHGHNLVITKPGQKLPHSWAFWEKHDFNILKRCDEVWVVCLGGWDVSRGVTAEIAYAEERKMLINYITPEGELL